MLCQQTQQLDITITSANMTGLPAERGTVGSSSVASASPAASFAEALIGTIMLGLHAPEQLKASMRASAVKL